MPLLIQRFNDFIKTQEITDEWQILAIANLIRVKESCGHYDAKFVDVAHVNATHVGIQRDSPAERAVWLFLRPQNACKVLEIERRDDKRVRRKSRRLDDCINLGLAGEVVNVELATADCFHVR